MGTRIPRWSASAPQILTGTIRHLWNHPENRGRRVWALSKYLAWQVSERTLRRPWTVRLLGPIRVRCYPHSPIASAVIYYGLADPGEMRFLLDYLKPGDEFIDVGANVGIYSLLAASVPRVRVLALEPSSLAYGRAAENIELNSIEERVTLVRQAVGRKADCAYLTVGFDAMNSLVEGVSVDPSEPVQVTTLDSVASEHDLKRVTLVKIDVEGWETDVLVGAQALFKAQRPAVIVEVNDPDGLELFRRAHGYQCVSYSPENRRLTPAGLADLKGHNAILVADVAAAALRLADGTARLEIG